MSSKYTLLELNKSIQENIKTNFPSAVWVIAEISEIKVNRNGHCYAELIEKDVINDNIIAKSRATIWAYTFRMVKPYFESTTGHELGIGIKILVQVNVDYHELYGLSLNIIDIDPNYTIGELAQKRAETIKKLEEEGVINMNKELSFPTVPQKIAIISSDTAAGYQDFINQLKNNIFGYAFYIKLFPSIMQGKEAEESIINSLENIYNCEDLFDIVVIIRGGGSQADLYCFNNYLLASNVAQFPLPILTGIGHDKDESVVDIVAHRKLKTPTAVAEYLVEKTSEFEQNINYLRDRITEQLFHTINQKNSMIIQFSSLINPLVKRNLDRHFHYLAMIKEKTRNISVQKLKNENHIFTKYNIASENKANILLNKKYEYLNNIKLRLKSHSKLYLRNKNHNLNSLDKRVELLNPENILKRGYSITYQNGARLKDISNVNENEEITTKLYSGMIRSKIIKKSKN